MMVYCRHPRIPGCGEAELPFYHVEGLLNRGVNSRFPTSHGLHLIVERDISVPSGGCTVFFFRGMIRNKFYIGCVSRIAPCAALVNVQQIAEHEVIADINGSSQHMETPLDLTIDADLSIHTDEPLVTYHGLIHIRIGMLTLVLIEAAYSTDACIDDGSPIELQTAFHEALIVYVKQPVAQMSAFHQAAESIVLGFYRQGVRTEIGAHERARPANFVGRNPV